MKFLALVFTSVLLTAGMTIAQSESVVLYKGSGDIAAAVLTANGLLVEEEVQAELVDLQELGFERLRGKLPLTEENQRLVFSDSGLLVLRMTHQGSGDYIEAARAEIFDSKGSFLFDLEGPGFSDAVVSNQGHIVGIKRNINIALESELLFFNTKGELIRRIPLPAVTEVKISSSSSGVGAISGLRGLVLYTIEGVELVELGPCQWFDFNIDESERARNYIRITCAYTNGDKIGFYTNGKPQVRWEKSFGEEVFRDISIRVGETTDIVAASKHNLYFIDGYSGEVKWKHRVEPPVSFTSCDIHPGGIADTYIAWGWEMDEGRSVPPELRHVKGGYSLAVRKFGGSEFSVNSEELSYSAWNVFTPGVEFCQHGLLIQTRDEVRLLSFSEGGWK